MAKLFDINPELVDDRGFLDTLRVGLGRTCPVGLRGATCLVCIPFTLTRSLLTNAKELLSDANPMVVANALAALQVGRGAGPGSCRLLRQLLLRDSSPGAAAGDPRH